MPRSKSKSSTLNQPTETSTPLITSSATLTTANTPATSSSVVLGAPPNVVLPSAPAGFTPINFIDYRGKHPRAGQVAAAPDAVSELRNFPTFAATFGAAVPSASDLADGLDNALRWTAMRVAGEAFIAYLKSGETVTWSAVLTDLDKLDTVVQLLASTNPTALAECPALVRMLDVPKAIAKRGHATRTRSVKAEAAKAAAANAAATPEPATTGAAPAPTGNGGATGH